MCKYKLIVGYLLVALLATGVYAQNNGNLRVKVLSLSKDTLQIDSLSMVPKSEIIRDINGHIISESNYLINYADGWLVWKGEPNQDMIKITYRSFPYSITKKYFHKDPNLIESEVVTTKNPFVYSYNEKPNDKLFYFGGLNKSGSIARGITIGNNQDVVVNSSLNLQLAGKLSEEIDIIAAITDENIPIQPEGNTQQIQEFDKVFIMLKHKQGDLTVGDFELGRPKSYFMNFYKKVKGGNINTGYYKISSRGKMSTRASYAISKGQYSRQTITIQEGNQGPYRLRGNNGEAFIIILAGTERVYIDGELLQRGEDHDYVINYNSSELTFTTNRLITKDKRVIIEFEYTDKNYVRSLMYLNNEYEEDRLKIRFNMFTEQDNKNKPFEQELTDKEQQLLSAIGDSLQDALVPNINSVAYNPDRVLYEMIDTTYFDSVSTSTVTYDSVFIHSTDPQKAKYQLGFAYVGSGKGDYIKQVSTINGRVFQWVPRVGGVPQGDYEPITLLITPKKQQLYTVGFEYDLSKYSKLNLELAVSNNDLNQFSKKDSKDNVGYAVHMGLINKHPLKKKDDIVKEKKGWYMHSGVKIEFTDRYFKPIENYRPIEFTRDWNLKGLTSGNNEVINRANLGLSRKKTGNINYLFSSLIKGDQYKGFKNALVSDLRFRSFHFSTNSSYLNANSFIGQSTFLRPRVDLSRSFKHFKVGVLAEQENNQFIEKAADTLAKSSFKYNLYKAYIASVDTAVNKFNIDYTRREDYAPLKNKFHLSTIGNTFNLGFDLLNKASNQLHIETTYRELKIIDQNLSSNQPDQSILGRIEYGFYSKNRLVSSVTYYEIGTGQERKQEYTYVKVPEGQGLYVYDADYNDNGIKDLIEFVRAKFTNEANYIRVFVPTDEYEQTLSNKFSQTFYVRPEVIWRNKKGFRKLISRFSDQASFKINRKVRETPDANLYNPFVSNVADSALMSLGSFIRNTIYFNRTNPTWGFDFNLQDNRDKVLLVNGFNTREKQEYGAKWRWNISRFINFNTKYNQGTKSLTAEAYTQKNYLINYQEVEPKLSYQPGSKFRVTLLYKWLNKDNKEALGGEHALNQEVSAEFRYSEITKGILNAKLSYIGINYTGGSSSAKSYEMLEGLQPGNNMTWQVAYQKKLANNMQISLNYNGRKSKEVAVIHTGGVQVRAMF